MSLRERLIRLTGIISRCRNYLKRVGLDRYRMWEIVSRKENAVAHLFSILFFYLCIALLFPYLTALYYGEDPRPWIFPILLMALISVPLLLRFKAPQQARPTETLFVVSMAWLATMVIGSIPYMMYGMGMLDALFEAMSGFTTTGATIMTDIESWPQSLLLWRSFTQWLGGAGIIMIFVTILPLLGVGGRQLLRGESPGMGTHPPTMRIREEVRKFHLIYMGLSLLLLMMLYLTGIGVYDSIVTMFSTISTGGFSPHSESIAFYGNPMVEWVIIVFMFLGGTSFYLHFKAISSRSPGTYLKSSEFRTYMFIVLAAVTICSLFLWDTASGEGVVRKSMFQVISLFTSTGFSTADYVLWESPVVLILFILMVIGGCTGSTAGGIKVARFLLSWKFVKACLYKTVHPKAVFSIKHEGRSMGENVITSLIAVSMCYLATAFVSTTILIAMGIEPVISMGASIATLSNIGPALGELGPLGTYAFLPDAAKVVLIFNMWVGRLEFLSVLVIITPVFWKELLRYRE
ncbi:MAG: TrkH family potassium uptake protein [Methanomassiliicoccales archaeon]